MNNIIPVDVSRHSFRISRDLKVSLHENKPGPPERIDGLTAGIVAMDRSPPHNGEVHPDGDEILYVISGSVSVTSDSNPDERMTLEEGDACIVKQGEWHKVHIESKARLLFITPGPNGDYRPL